MRHGLQLPMAWKQPNGEAAGKYDMALEADEKAAPPDPMSLFGAGSLNKYHVDTTKVVGGHMKDFVHNALDALAAAVGQWQAQAKFQNLKIMAVSAIGTP